MEKENERYIKALVEKDAEGKLIAIASTEMTDREGESLAVEGWDLKEYKKNPVLLWSHDAKELPVGTAKNIKVAEYKPNKKALIFQPIFHELTDLAKTIKTMFEEGILNAFSVGFLPTETDGSKYLKQELLEISAVNVPANPQSMVIARSIFGEDKIKDIFGETKETKSPACRQSDETKKECMSRKISEIMKENPEMKQEQAVAMASSMCDKPCKDCEVETKEEEKPKYIYVTENDLIDKRLNKIEEHLAYLSRSEKGTGREDNAVKVNRRLVKALNKIVYKLDK